MIRSSRRFRLSLGLGLIGVGSLQLDTDSGHLTAPTPANVAAPAVSNHQWASDFGRAATSWQRRQGPRRQVVDVVCLVPDVPTFFEAIAAWDESHYFPILIDDTELTLKFVRAFRPARIIRYPRRAGPIPPQELWGTAAAAVGRAWSREASTPPGDSVPPRLGPTPPGAVLSAGSSPMLAGAVALAAGRFEPLLRCEIPGHFSDRPSRDEAIRLAVGLESRVSDTIGAYETLGDDCDFLTLAGNWPYSYQDKAGPGSFDDLVGRSIGAAGQPRWAFTGRLLGDPAASVYRAMCSLFLTPESALLLNTYTDPNPPWSEYRLTQAAGRLARVAPVTLREGNRANLSEWYRVFDQRNRFGFLMINTHGSPTMFHVPGGPAATGDIPPSVPTAIVMIHSFSAEDPNDPETIAGRWLANGAFVYFGALNEPFLYGFRPPTMVAELIGADLPLAAAVWRTSSEPYGQPWRLVYLGDPLYRLLARQRLLRAAGWAPVATWPAAEESPQPDSSATEADRLRWALKTALYRLQRTARPERPIDLAAFLLAIEREQLDSRFRTIHDALLIDTLLEADQGPVLLERLARIRRVAASSQVARTRQWLQLSALEKIVAARDLSRALAFWSEVLETDPPVSLLQVVTDRVAAVADTPVRRDAWRARLRNAQGSLDGRSPLAPLVAAELKRVEQQLTNSR
jgi:hypothetical protein